MENEQFTTNEVSDDATATKVAWEGQALSEPPMGRVLFRVMRAVMFDDAPLAELDALPLAQMRLLWAVFFTPGAIMKDYSERLAVSQSTVTQLVDRLVRRGLVERHHDTSDRRVIRLNVSDPGREILNAAQARQRQTFTEVWAAMSPDERAAVMNGLELLASVAESVRAGLTPHMTGAERRENSPFDADRKGEAQPVMDLMARRVRGKIVR